MTCLILAVIKEKPMSIMSGNSSFAPIRASREIWPGPVSLEVMRRRKAAGSKHRLISGRALPDIPSNDLARCSD